MMATKRYEWDDDLTSIPVRHRRAWSGWFRQHGVSAHDVAVPGWLEVDDTAQELRYQAVSDNWDATKSEFTLTTQVQQLEGQPLPVPPELDGYLVTPAGGEKRHS